jgi:hypothetical protein
MGNKCRVIRHSVPMVGILIRSSVVPISQLSPCSARVEKALTMTYYRSGASGVMPAVPHAGIHEWKSMLHSPMEE